eukprot:8437092-Karenia_brevis.AAC.1
MPSYRAFHRISHVGELDGAKLGSVRKMLLSRPWLTSLKSFCIGHTYHNVLKAWRCSSTNDPFYHLGLQALKVAIHQHKTERIKTGG